MSYGAAIDALSEARRSSDVTTVTIPEGYSRAQAAQLVEEDGLTGSYMKETVQSKYLNPAKYGGKKAKNLEGFLFPDTFELKPKAPVADLVQLQLKDFKQRIKGVDMKYAKSKNLTVYDVLTIASMIEREAGVAKQRKLVAAVIYNRLHEGMPLGIDATIRFATGNYSEPLTESELAIDSPYNTRTNAGLPPGPINSPGLAAIEAAAHPAKTELPLLREQARTRATSSPSPRPKPNSKRTSQRTTRRAKQPAATSRPAAGNERCRGWRSSASRSAHSRSPAMQNAALAALGLAPEWSYEAIEVAPEEFEAQGPGDGDPRLRRRQRHRPAQGGGAGAGRRGEPGGAARSAPPTRSASPPTGSRPTTSMPALDRRRQHRRRRPAGGAAGDAAGCARAGARGRRRRPAWSGPWSARGRGSRSGTAPRPAPSSSCADASAADAVDGSRSRPTTT